MSHVTTLEQYGWNRHFDEQKKAYRGLGALAARVAVEYPSEYLLFTEVGDRRGVLAGRLRGLAKKQTAVRPVVGDWVMIDDAGADQLAKIHHVLPRKTSITRKAAGRVHREQVIASNVDSVFVVCSLDVPPNVRSLERYLSLVHESGAQPVLVLTKADRCNDVAGYLSTIASVSEHLPVHVVSATNDVGLNELDAYLKGHKTVAVIGTSGVGKSTLINHWLGSAAQEVGAVRDDGTGRHTTTNRFLLLSNRDEGGLVMDTPGMRELGLLAANEGVGEAFADIAEFATGCRFRDCAHTVEPECAVQQAIQEGKLSRQRFESYSKLKNETRAPRY